MAIFTGQQIDLDSASHDLAIDAVLGNAPAAASAFALVRPTPR